jgi:hypothetical protein
MREIRGSGRRKPGLVEAGQRCISLKAWSGGRRQGRRRPRTAQRHQVAPQIAAAVDLDEARQSHGGKSGLPMRRPAPPGLLRLQAVQIVRRVLRMGGDTRGRSVPLVSGVRLLRSCIVIPDR